MIDYQKELNPSQYDVVTSGAGPSLVLAGAEAASAIEEFMQRFR